MREKREDERRRKMKGGIERKKKEKKTRKIKRKTEKDQENAKGRKTEKRKRRRAGGEGVRVPQPSAPQPRDAVLAEGFMAPLLNPEILIFSLYIYTA